MYDISLNKSMVAIFHKSFKLLKAQPMNKRYYLHKAMVFFVQIIICAANGGCQSDHHFAPTAGSINLLMNTPSKSTEEYVTIQSSKEMEHICLRISNALTHSLSVDSTFLTIEFNDIKDLSSRVHVPATPGMGRYRLVIVVYDSVQDRDSALHRASSWNISIDTGNYKIASDDLNGSYSYGSAIAISRIKPFVLTLYVIFDQGQQKAVRISDVEAVLSFIDSSLVPCQRK